MTYTIIKYDASEVEAMRYSGDVLYQDRDRLCVRAPYTLPTRDLGYVWLEQGDIFVEWFYTDRWYNVFLLYDGDNGAFKGCYCNFTRPARITAEHLIWVDLALDLWVFPSGETLLLDEDEYAELQLDSRDDAAVKAALAQVRQAVAQRAAPFDALVARTSPAE